MKPSVSFSALFLSIALAAGIGLLALVYWQSAAVAPTPISYSEFIDKVDKDEVKSVVVNGQQVSGDFVSGGAFITTFPENPAAVDRLQSRAPVLFSYLTFAKESFDRLYDYYVAKVQQRFAMLLNLLEQVFLAGWLIHGGARLVGLVGLGARALHVGRLNVYVYWFLLGVVLLWGFATGLFYPH